MQHDQLDAPDDSRDTLKLLQSTTLAITKAIAAVCDKHNLSYSLIFGSLIGAVRHQGFIPWDDDLDIAMPRPDFEAFLEIAPNELDGALRLVNYQLGNTKRYVTRVVDDRLLLKLNSYNDENVLPSWVDVFAIDGIPDDALRRAIHYGRINWRKAMCAFASFDSTVNQNRPGRPKWQQLIIDFCAATHFGSWLDERKQLDKYDQALKRYAFDYGKDCCCGVGTYSPSKQTWKREAFESLVKSKFEDTLLLIPSDYDSVLSVTYKDYLQLPPESQRTVHSVEVVQYPDSYRDSK